MEVARRCAATWFRLEETGRILGTWKCALQPGPRGGLRNARPRDCFAEHGGQGALTRVTPQSDNYTNKESKAIALKAMFRYHQWG